jgi:hypothetical protein
MEMIAERGLEKLTMAALGREVGMNCGHLLYSFHSQDELLLRTLKWSEGRLGAEPAVSSPARPPRANSSLRTSTCTSPTVITTPTGPCDWRSGAARRTLLGASR